MTIFLEVAVKHLDGIFVYFWLSYLNCESFYLSSMWALLVVEYYDRKKPQKYMVRKSTQLYIKYFFRFLYYIEIRKKIANIYFLFATEKRCYGWIWNYQFDSFLQWLIIYWSTSLEKNPSPTKITSLWTSMLQSYL